ncbi:MAG: hypothetical protein ACYS6W_09910 [Planctomycetota bacterium]
MKRCSKCKKLKDESEFSKRGSRKDVLRCWCKKCESQYSHKYYRRNRREVRKQRSYEEFHRIADGVKQKLCNKCKQWKPEDEFHKRRKSKDGLQWYCKVCLNEAAREYREQRLAVN